jgi:hypothetical protein
MKSKNTDPAPAENDHLFDLLADGQLDEPRRRELLSGLDDRPGGWRQCALAFLEAQSWREAMDAFAHPRATALAPAESGSSQAARPTKTRRRPRRDYLTMALGVAACILLGIGIQSWRHDMQAKGVMGQPGLELADVSSGLAPEMQGTPPVLPVYGGGAGPGQNVQFVNLSGNGPDGQPHTARLPAVARDRLDENWLQNLPSAIPEEITRSFQQAGHEVRGSRQLLPFRLKDGRRLVVPVDQLDVHYINNPTYQ